MSSVWLKKLFFLLVVRPLVILVLGVNIRHTDRVPRRGPAIILANHNSHLDTFVLMSLFRLKRLPELRPVAAGDYFLRNKFLAWFSQSIVGIIPIQRTKPTANENPMTPLLAALDRGETLILFPEGTRGEPEKLSAFKSGVAHLMRDRPNVPVTPVFLHGLGKALPRGEALLVPYICDINVGDAVSWQGDKGATMELLQKVFAQLKAELPRPEMDD
ncbi:lysophospholipid acyltransferase family protein [Cerasicoccus frondis]|uniref:lysophospholipid acyltransferase family protein n=1 Tax=Cerasicoccus frondis TaxID=490090 RepID=UPI00285283E4|nr:lysophospholipid acyltransferase family protein [Cerasicoccus frondis]